MALVGKALENAVSFLDKEENVVGGLIGIISTNNNFPATTDQIAGDSIDLRIAEKGYVLKKDVRFIDTFNLENIEDYYQEVNLTLDGYPLAPGEVLYTNTMERIIWGSFGHYGEIIGRSVYAKLGISVHFNQNKISGGFKTVFPLQIINNNKVPVFIYPAQKLVQLIIHDYVGNYENEDYIAVDPKEATQYPFPVIKDKELYQYNGFAKERIFRKKHLSPEKKIKDELKCIDLLVRGDFNLQVVETLVVSLSTTIAAFLWSSPKPLNGYLAAIPFCIFLFFYLVYKILWFICYNKYRKAKEELHDNT